MKLAGIFVLIFALALPSAALAQGAGDEQYSDPFGGQQGEEEQAAPESTPEAAPEAAPVAPEAAPAPAPEQPAAPAQPAAAEQLPYTGADVGLLALGGALLVAAGVALRLRDRRRA
jgi:LPXTG-motif cell wall-anchored protein